MFESISILSTLIMFPLLSILIIMVIPENRAELTKIVGLCSSLITFIASLFLWLSFDLSTPKYQFVEHFFSVPYSNINVFIGIDGISLFFVFKQQ